MVAKKSKAVSNWLQTTAVRVTRVHFFYVAAFILVTIIFDTWNLYTHQAVSQLWTAAGILLIVNIIIWYFSRTNFSNKSVYLGLIWALIVADIIFASYNVSWQRGIASKSVFLFTIPIIMAATLRSRTNLFAVTAICAAAYSTTSVRYFFQNYGQAYRIELWGTVGFYSALFFILALLLMIIIAPTSENF